MSDRRDIDQSSGVTQSWQHEGATLSLQALYGSVPAARGYTAM